MANRYFAPVMSLNLGLLLGDQALHELGPPLFHYWSRSMPGCQGQTRLGCKRVPAVQFYGRYGAAVLIGNSCAPGRMADWFPRN
jgi:hypothetical protein